MKYKGRLVARLNEDDHRFGMGKGDVLLVGPYPYDEDKWTVCCRLSDGYDPQCNVYRHQITILHIYDIYSVSRKLAEKEGP